MMGPPGSKPTKTNVQSIQSTGQPDLLLPEKPLRFHPVP